MVVYPENTLTLKNAVILSPRFSRAWGSHLLGSFFINTLKDEILTSHNTFLRMTEWLDEILTSTKQKSVGLLAMTDLDNSFHPQLILQSSM